MRLRTILSILFCLFLSGHQLTHPPTTQNKPKLVKIEALLFDNAKGFFQLSFFVVDTALPFTQKEHLKSCNSFDVEAQAEQSRQCTNEKYLDKRGKHLDKFELPVCYVITDKSPDVKTDPSGIFDYINIGFFDNGKVLAFYNTETHEIFLVENLDIRKIYRHELQHRMLHIAEGGEKGDHDSDLWQVCEPARYDPSKETIEHAKKHPGVRIPL